LQIILIAGDYGWKQNLRLFPPGLVSKRKIPPSPPVHAVSGGAEKTMPLPNCIPDK